MKYVANAIQVTNQHLESDIARWVWWCVIALGKEWQCKLGAVWIVNCGGGNCAVIGCFFGAKGLIYIAGQKREKAVRVAVEDLF